MEPNFSQFKMQRNAHRQKNLLKNREKYQKREATRGLVMKSAPVSYRLARPHKGARAAARSLLSKGKVHGGSDMPSISLGDVFRKPSVSKACVPTHPSSVSKLYLDEDMETHMPDDESEKTSPTLSLKSDIVFSFWHIGQACDKRGQQFEDAASEKLPTSTSEESNDEEEEELDNHECDISFQEGGWESWLLEQERSNSDDEDTFEVGDIFVLDTLSVGRLSKFRSAAAKILETLSKLETLTPGCPRTEIVAHKAKDDDKMGGQILTVKSGPPEAEELMA